MALPMNSRDVMSKMFQGWGGLGYAGVGWVLVGWGGVCGSWWGRENIH